MSRSPGATVGGQAVLEGVMMRAPDSWAVACRRPDGTIIAQRNELPRLSGKSRLRKVPFIRGVLVLVESLSLGGNIGVEYFQEGDRATMEQGQPATIVGGSSITTSSSAILATLYW